MSFGRKTYDGDFAGRHSGSTERGDSLNRKGQAPKSSPPKRTTKNARFIENEESPFQEDGEKDRYLITYADLITLLLGLFIILYAISNIDAKKYEKMISAMGNVFGSGNKVINIAPGNNVPMLFHPRK